MDLESTLKPHPKPGARILRILNNGLPVFEAPDPTDWKDSAEHNKKDLRRQAEKFFLAQEAEAKKRRHDPLGDEEIWNSVVRGKEKALEELLALRHVFSGITENHAPDEHALSLRPAILEVKAEARARDFVAASVIRKGMLTSEQHDQARREILESVKEEALFLETVVQLMAAWRIKLVPYADHVFHESDSNYPYISTFRVDLPPFPLPPRRQRPQAVQALQYHAISRPTVMDSAEVFISGATSESNDPKIEAMVRFSSTLAHLMEKSYILSVGLRWRHSSDSRWKPMACSDTAVPNPWLPPGMTSRVALDVHRILQRAQWAQVDAAIFITALEIATSRRSLVSATKRAEWYLSSWDTEKIHIRFRLQGCCAIGPAEVAVVLSFKPSASSAVATDPSDPPDNAKPPPSELAKEWADFSVGMLRHLMLSTSLIRTKRIPYMAGDIYPEACVGLKPAEQRSTNLLDDWLIWAKRSLPYVCRSFSDGCK